MKFNTTRDMVKEILKADPATRDDDNKLFAAIFARCCDKMGIDVKLYTAYDFFNIGKIYGFPAYETVHRARQYIQARCPELGPSPAVSEYRRRDSEDFKQVVKK